MSTWALTWEYYCCRHCRLDGSGNCLDKYDIEHHTSPCRQMDCEEGQMKVQAALI